MSTFLFNNNATSTLAGAINNTQTTLTLSSGGGALFPNPGAGQQFSVTLLAPSNPTVLEVCWCTSRTGDVLTIVRGQEGTTGAAWSAGISVANLVTAAYLNQSAQQNGGQNYAVDSGTGSAYVVALAPAVTVRQPGMPIRMKALNASVGGATTINYGPGVLSLLCRDGSNPRANDIVAGDIYTLVDNGTSVFAMELLGNKISEGITDNSAVGTVLTIDGAGNPSWVYGSVAAFQSGLTGSANILSIGGGSPAYSLAIHNSNNTLNTANGAASVLLIGRDGTTSRSINAGGTVNASGSDYADYETKGADCGVFAKGALVGYDSDGLLTDKWSKAISFGIKSTSPSYVGGDIWGAPGAVGDRPRPPKEPLPPALIVRAVGETDDAWGAREAAFSEAVDAFIAASAAYPAALAQYETDFTAFAAKLEIARATVDRIAKAGKVPAIVGGSFSSGDYVVAAQGTSDTIVAIATPSPTADEAGKVVGRVRVAAPTADAYKRLVDNTENPGWTAIVEIIHS